MDRLGLEVAGEPVLLTVREVAEILGIAKEEAIREFIKSGELRAVNFSGRTGYRIEPKDLHDFLERRKQRSEIRAVTAATIERIRDKHSTTT